MRDVLPTLLRWRQDGIRFAIATVVQTWGSSPRPVGSCMGVSETGQIVGSVSGGCVESAVIQTAQNSILNGQSEALDFAQVSDAAIWEVGLSCGGQIKVWVQPQTDPAGISEVHEQIVQNEPLILVRSFASATPWLIDPNRLELPAEVESIRPHIEEVARTQTPVELEATSGNYFIQYLAPEPTLLVIGAVHIAIPLLEFAKALGFRTILIDPRVNLLAPERFPVPADEVLSGWPRELLPQIHIGDQTYAAVLTHDPKIDDDALEFLLQIPIPYVGALGSRITQEKRRHELRSRGLSEAALSRLHGPIGLNINSRSPAEIALSILAEIVQVRNAVR